MTNSALKKAYNPDTFREQGHQLINQLSNHLDKSLKGKSKTTIQWKTPEGERQFWLDFLESGDVEDLFSNITQRSIHIHNLKYIGHQVAPALPLTALSNTLAGLLSNGSAVYEMGKVSSVMEHIIAKIICKAIGYSKNSGGFLTSGGTLATLTALLTARQIMVPDDVWQNGNKKQLGIMVSEQAHYCVDRAARIMGLGEQGVIKIPVTENFNMDTAQLEDQYQKAKAKGIHIFAIVGSAPSTATGSYDSLDTIGEFSRSKNIWFHVDGAHGGAAIFSEKYKYLLKGIDTADSVIIDGHKMMMLPNITTALLYKNTEHSHATFSQKADYLLQQSEDEDWYNMAKRTFECTKNMMSIHWYAVIKTYGISIFDDYVTSLYDLGHEFAKRIKISPNFELALEPQTNIVCFRFCSENLNLNEQNVLNRNIREQLLEDGEFYIVETALKGVHYLRTTIMNPFTTIDHLNDLLKVIKLKAHSINAA
ncbi:MAG: aminotransferase class I/II-fold pyridoxal phosphate-dependent enzyme [Flavobacteriaceae bacterium]|nr:aminotransferase class I/II-fold pyridoxal phosphate-dependent enzyme [Flavobacteriaceae bacterium]